MVNTPWLAVIAVVTASLVQTPPVPKPFPQPGQPPAAQPAPVKPAAPGTVPETQQVSAGTSSCTSPGAPIYPTSEFLESFDAGRGQQYCLFGTNAAFTEIVGYYKNVLKNGGRSVMDAPGMQQWELGKFQEQTMAFPPSVVVKDYTWGGSEGYLFVDGVKEKRFKTVIQIVPAPSIR
jgi:hypothetical protein